MINPYPGDIVVTRIDPSGRTPGEHVAVYADTELAERAYYQHAEHDYDLHWHLAEAVGLVCPDPSEMSEMPEEASDAVLALRDRYVASFWKQHPLGAIARWYAYDNHLTYVAEVWVGA